MALNSAFRFFSATPRLRGYLPGLLLLLCIFAAPCAAAPRQVRAPADAEKLFNQLGATMTCTCGCRESLLACSHNMCPTKPVEQAYLRQLCEDAAQQPAAIRSAMSARFGEKILQAPGESLLYPLLIAGAVVMIAGFGALVWIVRGRTPKAAEPEKSPAPAPASSDPVLDARIEREIKNLE